MEWTEYHHAWIVSEFYQRMLGQWQERGEAAFIQAARTYGEQRGKRMAMRAIRDGKKLDFETYFSYGEYEATAEFFETDMWCEPGVVHERVTACPWARMFEQRDLKACGAVYCKEIDKAVVRGFNPELVMKTESTQHFGPCCRFYFYGDNIEEDLLEHAEEQGGKHADIRMPLSFHCVHVYHVFSETVKGVFGTEGEIAAGCVLREFEKNYGKEAAEFIRSRAERPFETVINQEEWEKIG